MDNIFNIEFYFTKNRDNCTSLFKSVEEFESFQIRMGLENLCQNTLVFPVGKYPNGKMHYDMHTSPHSKKFYNRSCLRFCANPDNSIQCKQMMYQITTYFCEGHPIESSGVRTFSLYPYDEIVPQKQYMFYQCPFVNLYKCAFPIYVENVVVAVLFTGQFPIGTADRYLPFFNLVHRRPDNAPSIIFNRHFKTKETLMNFVRESLLPVIVSFSQKAQEKLFEQRERLLYEVLENRIRYLENEVTVFLANIDAALDAKSSRESAKDSFWNIVERSLNPYLTSVEVHELFVFMNDSSSEQNKSKIQQGVQLSPTLKQGSKMIFDFGYMLDDVHECSLYTLNDKGHQTNEYLLAHLINEDAESLLERYELVVHLDLLQPFAVAINFVPDACIWDTGVIRKKVLEHLELFFSKVAQELVHFSIHQSEQVYKSVLRIYRHEIIHQVSVLNHNNLFLDIEKLRETDENKLRHVAEDQRQCIHELNFITHNINVFTGRVSKQSADVDKNQLIDVSNSIINKVINLYQRAKRDKLLWFLIQNNSKDNTIMTNQSLLDMIFFNLMNNAIKYAYPGTNIIIGFNDTVNHNRPHSISVTDFGVPVEADYHDQIFKMYFRGNNTSEQIEGSGIGLYVANEVADILDAKLTWTSKWISDYNIPLLMRYLRLSPELQKTVPVDPHVIFSELQRLQHTISLNQVFNDEYWRNPNEWNELEIQEELICPTYRVTFLLEL